jgi:hypothetical protein
VAEVNADRDMVSRYSNSAAKPIRKDAILMIFRNTMGFALTGLALPGATAPAFDAQGRYWAHVAVGFDHTSGIGTSG